MGFTSWSVAAGAAGKVTELLGFESEQQERELLCTWTRSYEPEEKCQQRVNETE